MKFLASVTLYCILFILATSAARQGTGNAQTVFDDFSRWLAQKYRVVYLKNAAGRLVDSDKVSYSISFADDRQLTVDQARPLMVAMIQTIERMVFDDEEFEKALQTLSQDESLSDGDLIYSRLGIKLSLWQSDMERPTPPHLAEVRFAEGSIFYYQTGPDGQSLGNPLVESYATALHRARYGVSKTAQVSAGSSFR